MTRFFKLTSEMSDFLRENLTLSEWKLWSYLVTLDPFGDQYQSLPPVLTILEKCNISKATFYRAIAKFQDLELFDFQERGIDFRNLYAEKEVSPVRQESHGCDKNLMDEAQSLNNETLSICTDLQTLSDKSEKPDKNPEDSQNGQGEAIATGEVTEVLAEKEKRSEARTNKVKQCSFNWLPDGPWSIDGKLDPNFRDWLAHAWLSQYGGDIHRRRADVLSHFKKDPANLPIRWEQYQSEFLNRFENAQILVNNGVEMGPDYEQTLIANQRAITQSLPQEMNPIAPSPYTTIETLPLTQGVQSVELPETPQAIAPVTTPAYVPIPENGENWQAYKLFKPKPVEEAPITPEQWEETRKKLAALTGKFSFGKPAPKPLDNSLESLNRQLHDPALREAAIAFAKNSPDFKYCPNSNEIITCEEF